MVLACMTIHVRSTYEWAHSFSQGDKLSDAIEVNYVTPQAKHGIRSYIRLENKSTQPVSLAYMEGSSVKSLDFAPNGFQTVWLKNNWKLFNQNSAPRWGSRSA